MNFGSRGRPGKSGTSGRSGGSNNNLPPTSINSISYESGIARPACWDWSHEQILGYVRKRAAYFAQRSDKDPILRQQVTDVVEEIIIPCITKRQPYRLDLRNLPEPISVSYHYSPALPISDIYSALGWFISIADPRAEGNEASSCLSDHFQRLVHYTKLVYTLSLHIGAGTVPRKTHLLLSVEYAPIIMLGASMTEAASLSSSLPDSKGKGKKAKNKARADRAASGPENGHIQHSDQCFAQVEDDNRRLGHCAETLNILSQMRSDSRGWIYVWGTALDVPKFDMDFINYNEFKQEGVHTPACYNCRVFFRRSNATYMDITTAEIQGPLPDGYEVDKDWKSLIPCQRCGQLITKEQIENKQVARCKYGCASFWCGGDKYLCHQKDDPTHGMHCPELLKASEPEPPAANPSYLPAVAGHPPIELAQQYHYNPIHTSSPFPPPISSPSNPMAPAIPPASRSSWGINPVQAQGSSWYGIPNPATNMMSMGPGISRGIANPTFSNTYMTGSSRGVAPVSSTSTRGMPVVPGLSRGTSVPGSSMNSAPGVPIIPEETASGPFPNAGRQYFAYPYDPRFQPGNQYYGP